MEDVLPTGDDVGRERSTERTSALYADAPRAERLFVRLRAALSDLAPAEQRALLAMCYQRLQPGGALLWKSQVRRPRWKFWITYAQEWLMTQLGPTTGRGLYFLDTPASVAALRDAGFEVTIQPMPSWRPYTDILFIGRKR